ncbi:hypothetical protein [Chroococcus sp. FPU101]|uniref:hypothetical protein n=1 Tax=Chroococcus sp. FPU101 TaxID=1974212 RepID=UPI001A8F6DB5|nr:hypothetical protein [Chroococcus sp. FPU101]GFE68610.1 hypothetical protein CFPU101_12200 [Chroococcus sp. FPU101]
MIKKRNTIEIYFPEYQLDYQEMYEISEIRNRFTTSMIKGIPWFYFLNFEEPSISLKLLFSCTCDVQLLNVEDEKHLLEIRQKEQISYWLTMNFHNLNSFIDSNDIPEEINKEISESIFDWLKKNLIGF